MKLDPDFVLEQIAKAPREFDLQARNPERNIHVGGQHMAFASVYGCPFVRKGDERREATMDDDLLVDVKAVVWRLRFSTGVPSPRMQAQRAA